MVTILVPEELQDQKLPADYWPMDRIELQKRLDEKRQQEIRRQLSPTLLSEAVYVAALSRDTLTSELSGWSFAGGATGDSVELGKVSVALREARGLPDGYVQLSASQWFGSNGDVNVQLDKLPDWRWFGFQTLADRQAQVRRFTLELPRALKSCMLLSVDAHLKLRSRDVTVVPVEDPAVHLPPNWPTEARTEANDSVGQRRWWFLNLAGIAQFTLDVDLENTPSLPARRHSLKREEHLYSVGRGGVDVVSLFEFASGGAGQPVHLRLEKNHRIKSIRADGQSARWSYHSEDQDGTVVTLLDCFAKPDLQIQVETLAAQSDFTKSESDLSDISEGNSLRLPQVQLLSSFALTGSTQVVGRDGMVVEKVESELLFMPQTIQPAEVERRQGTPLIWESQWMGEFPGATAYWKAPEPNWNSTAITRLTVQPGIVSSLTRVRLQGADLQSNQLRIPVGGGWQVDSLNLLEQGSEQCRVQLQTDSIGATEIVIDWAPQLVNLELDLEIQSHLQMDKEAELLEVQTSRVLQMPSGRHSDFYVFDELNGYRLKFDSGLIQMAVPRRELELWQQSLVPSENAVIYKSQSDYGCRFTLLLAPGVISSQSVVSFQPADALRWQVSTWIVYEAHEGQVDHVRVLLPDKPELKHWRFKLVSRVDEIEIDAVETVSKTSGNGTELKLKLPNLMTGRFVVRATTELESADAGLPSSLELPLLAALPASTHETLVLVPQRWMLADGDANLNVISAGVCCHSNIDQLIEQVLDDDELNHANVVRVDYRTSQTVKLQKYESTLNKCWVERELVEHQIFDDGFQVHRVDVTVQSVQDQQFKCKLPSDWRFKRLSVNQQSTTEYTWNDGSLKIPLSGGSSFRVQFELESQVSPGFGLESIDLHRPTYEIPVMQRIQKMLLSPRRVIASWRTLGHGTTSSQATHWSHRLRPWYWWNTFASGVIIKTASEYKSLWNEYLLDQHSDKGSSVIRVWVVDGNALFMSKLAGMLCIAAISWSLLRRFSLAWWFALIAFGFFHALMPEGWVPLGQWLLLSFVLGGMIRTAEMALALRGDRSRHFNRPKSSVSQAAATSVLVLLSMVSARAQDLSENHSDSQRRLFGVFVPSDQQQQPVGEFVYIPSSLRELLLSDGDVNRPVASVRFLSAQYVLKLRQPQRERGPIQEFSVELRVQSTDDNAEILLPFRDDQLSVVSAPVLNGRPRMMGVRNFKLAPNGEGIVFRPEAMGTFEIRLQFEPVLRESAAGQYRLEATVPPIPNATLRVVSENGKANSFTVNARGGTQRTFLGDTIAYLGALDNLEMNWFVNDRVDGNQTSRQTAETWVQAAGNRLWAACQLTISSGSGLPDELDLLVDSDWEPTGLLWGDAELVSNTPVSMVGKRTLYRIRIRQEGQRDPLIRMLLVPREANAESSLEVPFLSLERVVSSGRIFWWTGQDDSQWQPDTSESTPVGSDTFSGWGPESLSLQRTGFRVLGTGIKLRRAASKSGVGTFNELSTLHIKPGGTTLDFEATWEGDTGPSQVLWARIPSGSQIQRIDVDGKSAPYQVSSDPHLIQIVPSENGSKQADRLLITLDIPVLMDQVAHLPRIELIAWRPKEAAYQIYRGPGLNVEVEAKADGLTFSSTATSSQRPLNLGRLEVLVGEIKVDSSAIESQLLPLSLRVRPADLAKHQSFVTLVGRSEKNWTATVECTWGPQAGVVDYGFFEVPLGLRDRLSAGQQVCHFMPHADPSKTNLCLPVPPPDSQGIRRLQFSFPLESVESTQTIVLPEILSHHALDQKVLVALPEQINGQPIRWLQAGAVVQSSKELTRESSTTNDSFRLYELSADSRSLTWQAMDQQTQEVVVHLMRVDLTDISATEVCGHVSLWVDPHGQNSLDFSVPANCQVLGIQNGVRPAVWSFTSEGLRVNLQPNYLPASLQLSLIWQVTAQEQLSLEVPRPLSGTLPGISLLSVANHDVWQPQTDPIGDREGPALWVDHWAQMVTHSLGSVSELSQSDVRRWVDNWRPEAFQIDSQAAIGQASLQAKLSDLDLNDDGVVQVHELWSSTHLLLENTPLSNPLSLPAGWGDPTLPVWRWTGQTVQLNRQLDAGLKSAHWIAASALIVLSLLILLTVRRLPATWLSRLKNQSWFLWLVLALSLWFILPIAWPSWIALALSAWAAINQLLDLRRHWTRAVAY